MASSLAPNATVDEMENELAFMDVLIETLDPDADDFGETLAQYKHTKRDIEQRIAAARSRNQHGMDGANDIPFWRTMMNGGGSSSSAGRAPASQGMKRGFPNSLRVDGDDQMSKRPTPDPSNVGTPTSSQDSYELVSHPLASPGVQNGLDERARMNHMRAEAAFRRRREEEERNRAYAESLSQSQSRSSSTFGSLSSRPGIQTTIGHDGMFSRPPPPAKQEQSDPYQTGRSVYAQPPPQSTKPEPSIKPEAGPSTWHQLPQRSRPADNGVVDLTGDDDDDDVAEVAPTNFTPNVNRRVPQVSSSSIPRTQMPGAWPTPQTPAPDYSRFYGHQTPLPGYGNSVYPNYYPYQGAPTNFQPSTQGYLDPIQAATNLIGSGSSGYRGVGGSPNPLYSAYDNDDDLVYGGARPITNPLIPSAYGAHGALYNNRYDALAEADPTKTREEINALLENIRPDEDLPDHLRVQTPESLAVKLHKYQEMGLTWLKKCEESQQRAGILADDMGLGKTIQMLSLLVTRRSQDPRFKTTLIVAPVALMR